MTPASEDVVIRAAYRALMRRYHPDADPSSEASQRAASINAAYAVLSDPEKRARYDGSLAAQQLIKPEPKPRSVWRRFVPGPAGLLALGTLAVALASIAISPPIGVLPPDALPAGGKTPLKRVATPQKLVPAGTAIDGAGLCGDPAVAGLIRDELVRRAGFLGGDESPVGSMAGSAHVRVDAPTAKGEQSAGAAGCSAWLSVDLPPGLAVEGGRANLSGEASFGLVRSGDGGLRLTSLSGTRGLVRLLATVGETSHEPDSNVELVESRQITMGPRVVRPGTIEPAKGKLVEVRDLPKVAADRSSQEPANVAPSLTPINSRCRALSGWADQAVCNNRNLTGLERQLSLLYHQSWTEADATRRAALASTRDEFLGHRNSCRSETCLTNAYISRLREVSDIMAGRVQR